MKLLQIGDNPNIDIIYRDNIGRYYKKRFLLDVHIHNARLPLQGFFKIQLSRKEVEEMEANHTNTLPSSSSK